MNNDVITLREYFERLLTEHKETHRQQDNHVSESADALNRRLQEIAENLDKRFTSVNEFRGQLRDQVGTFLTREVYDAHVSSADTRFRVLEQAAARMGGINMVLASGASAVIAIVISVVVHFITGG
jgi:predicted RNA binding protein with dsRBD fold (UPF0201 family)